MPYAEGVPSRCLSGHGKAFQQGLVQRGEPETHKRTVKFKFPTKWNF
jgi:hypothetical protein